VDELDVRTLRGTYVDNSQKRKNNLLNFVNESGMYSLVFSSKLPVAKDFKRWVTCEVLPSIRKYGAYISDDLLADPEKLQETVTELQNKLKIAQQELEEAKPLIEFAKNMQQTEDVCTVGQFSKFLNAHKFRTSPNKLFAWMRDKHLLMSSDNHKNEPYQEYIDRGYFRTSEKIVTNNGVTKIVRTTLITGKGQEYISKRLANERIRELVKFKKLF
jgi:anti-repressor protein